MTKQSTGRKTFDDTKDINVEMVTAIGVVNGTGDNKFAPKSLYTREQSIVTILRPYDVVK